jgi:hypothetical protein
MPVPPNTYITKIVTIVVPPVSSVRDSVWLIESLTMLRLTWPNLPRFSRIRSNTTTVSFME